MWDDEILTLLRFHSGKPRDPQALVPQSSSAVLLVAEGPTVEAWNAIFVFKHYDRLG